MNEEMRSKNERSIEVAYLIFVNAFATGTNKFVRTINSVGNPFVVVPLGLVSNKFTRQANVGLT